VCVVCNETRMSVGETSQIKSQVPSAVGCTAKRAEGEDYRGSNCSGRGIPSVYLL